MADTFRALCAELAESVEALLALRPVEARTLWKTEDRLTRARAALAEEPAAPELKAPTDEELKKLLYFEFTTSTGHGERVDEIAFARAVLARWGNPAPAPPADGEAAELARLLEAGGTCPTGVKLTRDHCRRVAALLHRLQELAPAPPADGEVAELVAWLRKEAEESWQFYCHESSFIKLTRAAELLQRQALVQVPVSKRLPEPNTKVLAYYFNDLGKGRTICAIWVPAKSRSNADGDDDFTEYDEEDDKFYWPEGWYEAIENWDEPGWVKVYEGEVVCWQPLPKWPAHALPLPEASE